MRVLLSPDGTPIPLDALPDPSVDGDVPPYTLLLPPGNFVKGDYVALGYTHYEVWCIGAVGGKGGTLQAGTGYDSASKYYGGAGGGGGLHHVAGLLADLPALTPVVIGAPGADGVDNLGPEKWMIVSDYGDPIFPGIRTTVSDTGARPMVRNGVTYINADGSYAGAYRKINVLGDVISSSYHQASWDASGNVPSSDYMVLPNAAYAATTDGSDGGYSAFGAVCMASGGKGGKRAPMFSVGLTVGVTDERWAAYRRNPEDGWYLSRSYTADGHPGGDGGQGGKGGTLVPGGGGDGGSAIMNFINFGTGGAGSYLDSTEINPEDGPWDGDIGEGGGGGHGGGYRPNHYSGGGVLTDPAITALSQNGGQGSFNYGDTSKYGPRENRSADLGRTIIPGAGGGAKLSALQIYGGRSVGANPQGVVMIRIVRLV